MSNSSPLQYLRIPIKNPSETRGYFIDYAFRVYDKCNQTSANPLILVPGFNTCQDSSPWINIIKHLSKNRIIVTFDHRGIGHSKIIFQNNSKKIAKNIKIQFTVQDMADDIYKLISYLSYSSIDILGHSMGGMIVQTFAMSYPQLLSNLILCSTTPASGKNMPYYDVSLSKQYLSNNLALQKCKNIEEIKKQARINLKFSLSPDYVLTDKRLTEFITEGMKLPRSPIKVVKAQWKSLKVYNGINNLNILNKYSNEFNFGILIIHGDCDNIIDYRNSLFMHQKLKYSKLCIAKREGHMIFNTPNGLNICIKNISQYCDIRNIQSKL